MKAIIEAKKRQEEAQKQNGSIYQKLDFILQTVLSPDAFAHLNKLKEEEPEVYRKVFNELVSPDVFQNLDYLVAAIQRQGGVPRRIPLDVIIYLERQVKGIKSSIKVKRGDDMMDLGSYLTKE
ncbi:MAG: hypothetical protein P8Y97_17495 [Candidatus Lokiarchaeota archaeon]